MIGTRTGELLGVRKSPTHSMVRMARSMENNVKETEVFLSLDHKSLFVPQRQDREKPSVKWHQKETSRTPVASDNQSKAK